MKISVGNSYSRIFDATYDELSWADEYMSVATTKYRPGQYGKVTYEARVRMLQRSTGLFPTGLLGPLQVQAGRNSISLVVEDGRDIPCPVDRNADLTWLRDYQRVAVHAAVNAERGLIKVPTGGGKTEIFIGLTKVLPCEWLFVVHRTDLVQQAAARYHLRTGETCGFWEEGEWHKGSAHVTVATFQGLYTALKRKNPNVLAFLKRVQAINVDECHAVPAASFYDVTMACTNAYYRFGQSGTPLDRGEVDSLRTIGALGAIVCRMQSDTLVKAGVLSPPTIHMVPCVQKNTKSSTWAGVYRDLVVQSEHRNSMLADMAVHATKPALCFVEHISHGAALEKLMRARGLNVEFVNGHDWDESRRRAIKHLVQGKIDVLICSVIFQEGIDIPELESVIVGTGKASVVAALQRIGRGMRTAAGKTGFEVWDCLDMGQRWLANHAQSRLASYRKEGHTVHCEWPSDQLELPITPPVDTNQTA